MLVKSCEIYWDDLILPSLWCVYVAWVLMQQHKNPTAKDTDDINAGVIVARALYELHRKDEGPKSAPFY